MQWGFSVIGDSELSVVGGSDGWWHEFIRLLFEAHLIIIIEQHSWLFLKKFGMDLSPQFRDKNVSKNPLLYYF